MFRWDKASLGWFQEAAEYSDFHAQLAQRLMPYLDHDDSICDLGCGLGYLSLALAPQVRHITAIDSDEGALAVLRQNLAESGRINVAACQADGRYLPENDQWDAMILCFFGHLTQADALAYYLSHCRKGLIAVVSNHVQSHIAPSGISQQKKERAPEIAAFLRAQQVSFRLEEMVAEFGQPLQSVEDAMAYVQHYTPGCSATMAQAHLATHLQILADGRYYLPNQKNMGIFMIDKETSVD